MKILLIGYGLLHALVATAGYAIRSDEVMLLPPYCGSLGAEAFEPDAYKIFITKPKAPRFGPHMNHFCHGKKFIIRANNNLGNNAERGYLTRAAGEFLYVLNHTKADNKNGRFDTYLAITSIERAKVLQRLGDTAEAMQMFQQAIQYNPKLPLAYAGLSDIYMTQGMNDEARKILELGLKRIPKSKSLQRRLDKL